MFILALLLAIMPSGIASAENNIDYAAYRENQDFLKEDQNDWVCVDHAVNYSRHNPGWGVVIVSPSPRFSVQPHMTNYRIDGNTLLIHEAQVNKTYELRIVNGTMTIPYYEDFPGVFYQLWEGPTYFHFIPNETDVVRVYSILKDNRAEFFDYENLSRNDTTKITESDFNADIAQNGNNESNKAGNATISENTTTYGSYIKSDEETESFMVTIIRFVKSILGLVLLSY